MRSGSEQGHPYARPFQQCLLRAFDPHRHIGGRPCRGQDKSNHIAQPTPAPSSCTTCVLDGVASWYVDLRPQCRVGEEIERIPGVPPRVTLSEGSPEVNSSQGGEVGMGQVGERAVVILTAGALRVTQTAMARPDDAARATIPDAPRSVLTAKRILEVASVVGNTLRCFARHGRTDGAGRNGGPVGRVDRGGRAGRCACS